jgi:hypothetical protein
MNILSFGRNQKYYTPIRAFIDFIIGFIFSSIVLGYGLWLTPFMAPFCFGLYGNLFW